MSQRHKPQKQDTRTLLSQAHESNAEQPKSSDATGGGEKNNQSDGQPAKAPLSQVQGDGGSGSSTSAQPTPAKSAAREDTLPDRWHWTKQPSVIAGGEKIRPVDADQCVCSRVNVCACVFARVCVAPCSKGSATTKEGFFKDMSSYEQQELQRTKKFIAMGENASEDDIEDVVDADLSRAPRESPSVEGTDLEAVYREALRVILNRLGAHNDPDHAVTDADIYKYLQETFRVTDAQHQEFLRTEMAATKAEMEIKIKVVEAKNLEAKDPNGYSDPYCVLGIVQLTPEQMKGKSRRVTKLTESVVQTSVKKETLTPAWNEEFSLPFATLDDCYLQVDLWDRDEDDSVGAAIKRVSSVKGAKGFGRWMHHVAETTFKGQNDDFLGRLFVPLKTVSEGGVDQWYNLENKRHKPKGGQIRLQLDFVVDQDVEPVDEKWQPPDVYKTLYWEFVRHETTALLLQQKIRRWLGELSNTPKFILEMFRTQHQLSELEHYIVEWVVMVEYHQRHGVTFNRLLTLVGTLAFHYKESKDAKLSEPQLECLVSALVNIADLCLAQLTKQRDIFPPDKKPAIERLSCLLNLLMEVYSFDAFRVYHPKRSLKEDITNMVQEATERWFTQNYALFEPTVQNQVTLTDQLTDLVRAVKDDLIAAHRFYDKHFRSRVGVEYFVIVCEEYDKRLPAKVQEHLKTIVPEMQAIMPELAVWKEKREELEGEQLVSAAFKLYLAMGELMKFISELKEDRRKGLVLTGYLSWFLPCVDVWIEMAEFKAKQMVQRAVKLDTNMKITNQVKYSSSAIDVALTMNNLVEFCRDPLSSRDPEVDYTRMARVMDSIVSVVSAYGECLLTKLQDDGCFAEHVDEAVVGERLSVALNNMEYIKEKLEEMPGRMQWEEISGKLSESGQENASSLLSTLMSSCREDISNSTGKIVRQDIQRMKRSVELLVREMVKKMEGNAHVMDTVDGLMTYLTENLRLLCREVSQSTFRIVLRELWPMVLGVFLNSTVKDKAWTENTLHLGKHYFKKLQEAVKILVEFFKSDGHGLSSDEIDCEALQELKRYITLYCGENVGLLRQYYAQIVEEQDKVDISSAPYGSVTVELAYLAVNQTLYLHILHAKGLPAMDPTGFSDPYFIVTAEPAGSFQGIKPHKTKTCKKTLDPLINDSFSISVSPDVMSQTGSVFILHCMDWDRVTHDDFIGESLVPMKVAAEVKSAKDSGKRLTIPVMRPTSAPRGPFEVLRGRVKGDAEAAQIIKQREKVFKDSSEKVGKK